MLGCIFTISGQFHHMENITYIFYKLCWLYLSGFTWLKAVSYGCCVSAFNSPHRIWEICLSLLTCIQLVPCWVHLPLFAVKEHASLFCDCAEQASLVKIWEHRQPIPWNGLVCLHIIQEDEENRVLMPFEEIRSLCPYWTGLSPLHLAKVKK